MTRVLVPSGALGLGFDRTALAAGVANKPDIIAIDGGSTDSGPSYLGAGVSKYSALSTKAEWRDLMEARAQANVPLVIGTAGTCGADSAVDWLFDITRELAGELDQSIKVARLYAGQKVPDVVSALGANQITPLPGAPHLDAETLSTCTNIVALAGAEQVNAALATGADIVIAGRTTDTAIIAALPLRNGDHQGAAWHGAKVGECGALATTLPLSGVLQLDFDAKGVTLTPLAKGAEATPETVAAHMLYENSDPFILFEPGGHLDVTDAQYKAIDNRRVRIEGSQWHQGPYNVKLEGARIAGYQTVSVALLRDKRYVLKAHEWAGDIAAQSIAKVSERMGLSPKEFDIELRLMGKDATLGDLEVGDSTPNEVGVLAIVTADTQERATEIAKVLNPYLLHHPLDPGEQQPTFAFPFSPAEIPRGPLYEFCLHHTMPLSDPMQAFRLMVDEVGG